MFDELSMHLRQSASPEQQAAIEEATDFFEKFELPEWQDRYVDLLMTLDNGEMGDAVQAFSALTTNLQHVMLNNFQISVHDATSIGEVNLILRTLRDLETTELVEEIKTICAEETDPVEAFAALMVLIIADPYQTADTYYGFLQTVSQALIDKILETTEARTPDIVEDEIIDVEGDQALVTVLNNYMATVQVQDLMVRGLIHDGLRLNQPFQSYYERMVDFLAPVAPRKMAIELYGAFLVCKQRELDVRQVIGEALQLTYSSIDVITPIMLALDEIVLLAHIRQTSGVRKTSP